MKDGGLIRHLWMKSELELEQESYRSGCRSEGFCPVSALVPADYECTWTGVSASSDGLHNP